MLLANSNRSGSKVNSILQSHNLLLLLFDRRIKLIINYLLGPLLFLLICLSIYKQLQSQPNLFNDWKQARNSFMQKGAQWWLAALVLMVTNWGLEAWKWRQIVRHLMAIRWSRALLSVLAGVSFTMLTPNRMGEFLGRVLYMPDGSRFKAAALTSIGSISQLIITMSCGVAGLLYLKQLPDTPEQWHPLLTNVFLFGTMGALIVCLFVYFNLGSFIRLIEKWPPFNRYAPIIHAIGEIKNTELIKILVIAFLRYVVFLLQYWLVFRWFDISVSINWLVAGAAVMFLVLAVVPTISLAEIGIRGQVSLFVFGLFTAQSVQILLATAAIWLINIILPALAGSLILLGVKLFSKTET